MNHLFRTVLLTCLAAAAIVPAQADSIKILFNEPLFSVTPGQTDVTVLATLSNLDLVDTVYLNGDNLDIPGAVNVNDEFFTNAPFSLAPGASALLIELFRFDVPANAVAGIFTGSYELLGGVGTAAQFNVDPIGQQTFQVHIQAAPEPSSLPLLAAAVFAFLVSRRVSARRMIRTISTFAFVLVAVAIGQAATIYDTTVLAQNPVAFLPLSETSGTTANNLANSNENGTYHSVALGDPGGPDQKGGLFTPFPSYVGAQDYPAINVTTAFSIEAWVNVASAGSNALGSIFAINRAVNSTGIALWLNGNHPELGLNNGVNFAELSSGAVTDGAWNQIVVTWDQAVNGGAPLFYINGLQVGNTDANTFTGTLNLAGAPSFNIGAEFPDQNSAAGRWFNGGIEDVPFYNYRLSANQVAADFGAGTAAPEPSTLLLIGGSLVCVAAWRRK